MERMRESIFAALGDLTGLSFLDLFSGSGIIALEAASRGAAPVEAVESDPLKRGTLLKNTAISPTPVLCRFMPAELYIKRAKRSFNIIFCDPPFSYRYKYQLLQSVAESSLAAEGALVLLHHPAAENADAEFHKKDKQFHLQKTKRYGNSAVDFFLLQKKIL
jgi:16S rRNA (guanine(966)-N(2))-methyltransferase RsmD